MDPPLLRVSRPVSACSKCRSAKIKCDGKLPVCSACEKSNRADECFSANDQFAKGKERSYVSSLESHVERLEKEIAQAKARKGSGTMLDPDVLRPTSASARTAGAGRIRRKEASDVDDLVADFGFLSVNATARDFHGFTKEMSFARLVLSTSSNQELPRFSAADLPPRHMANRLIEHYYQTLFVVYPVLSEVALFGSLEAVYQQGGSFATSMDHWNVRMILAIAFASLSRSKGDLQYQDAVHHVSAALEQVEAVFQPGSVLGIRAILLFVHYALLDPSHFKSWYLIGVASRAMVDLGLHQDPPEEMRMKESQLQLRRRIFHCVYALDRVISMTYVRAFSFTDDSASVTSSLEIQMPLSITFGDQMSHQSSDTALQTLKFRQLQSTWYQALLQSNRQAVKEPWESRSETLHDMHTWFAALPNSIMKSLKNLFRSEMLYSSILLISPLKKAGEVCKVCEYGKALIFEYAVDYAKTMQLICEGTKEFAICTSLDMLRASFVTGRLLDVLQDGSTYIFDAIIPQLPPTSSSSRTPPPLSNPTLEPNLDRAIDCIQRMVKVLGLLEEKFGRFGICGDAKAKSVTVLQDLYARHNRRSLPTTQAWDPLPNMYYVPNQGNGSLQAPGYYRGYSW